MRAGYNRDMKSLNPGAIAMVQERCIHFAISQGETYDSIADFFSVKPSRVSRWRNGRETMPLHAAMILLGHLPQAERHFIVDFACSLVQLPLDPAE